MIDYRIIARLLSRPAEDPKPHLTEHGSRVDPHASDVDAIFAACARVLCGETVRSTTHSGAELTVALDHASGDAVLSVDGCALIRCCAHDAIVHAYGLISNFNIAWDDFHGGRV